MTRKILSLLLYMLMVKSAVAQSYLVTHRIINQNIQSGYFMQKPNTSLPDDDYCINATEARNVLYLNESVLPTDGRLPWWSELVPQKTVPCSSGGWLLCAQSNDVYSSCGSLIYSSFNNALTTYTRTQISTSNAFWTGNIGGCGLTLPGTATASALVAANSAVVLNTTDTSAAKAFSVTANAKAAVLATTPGPLNRCGVWVACNGTASVTNQWIGIGRTISVPATKTYYIGIGADNAFRLIIDGNLIVQFGLDGNLAAFRAWHILPVTLTAGIHYLNLEGYDLGAPGSMGAEIYDNTASEIINATSYAGLKLLFSTKDATGSYICTSLYDSCTGTGKLINGVCEQAVRTCLSSVRVSLGLRYRNTYLYTWSNGSTQTVTLTESSRCIE